MRIAILSLFCACRTLAAEMVPEDRTAVFSRDQAAGFLQAVCHATPDNISAFWSPTTADLKDIEASLSPFLSRARPELLKWLDGVHEGATRWTWLRRQAIGVMKNDRPYLLISYVCEYPPETRQKEKERKAKSEKMGRPYDAENWKTRPIAVHHGGMAYFRVLFDVCTREFTWYEENP